MTVNSLILKFKNFEILWVMEVNKTFILILQTKEFLIPSEFPFLFDVNPQIFKELITNGQYHVKSNVTIIFIIINSIYYTIRYLKTISPKPIFN